MSRKAKEPDVWQVRLEAIGDQLRAFIEDYEKAHPKSHEARHAAIIFFAKAIGLPADSLILAIMRAVKGRKL